jgi:hypothetical protein
MLTENEVQLRLLVSSSFRTRLMADAAFYHVEAPIAGLKDVSSARLEVASRLRLSDAMRSFHTHYFRHTFSLLPPEVSRNPVSLLGPYLEFCREQPSDFVDSDGSSFYRFLWQQFPIEHSARLLSVAAVEYLQAVLMSYFNAGVIGDSTVGFSESTRHASAYLMVLAEQDMRALSGIDTGSTSHTGVLLTCPTGTRALHWAALPAAVVPQHRGLIVHAAPDALSELLLGSAEGGSANQGRTEPTQSGGGYGLDECTITSPGCCSSQSIRPHPSVSGKR